MSQWKDFLFPECYKLQRTYTNHLNWGAYRKQIFLLAYFGTAKINFK